MARKSDLPAGKQVEAVLALLRREDTGLQIARDTASANRPCIAGETTSWPSLAGLPLRPSEQCGRCRSPAFGLEFEAPYGSTWPQGSAERWNINCHELTGTTDK